jgi:hypothetical protein
MSSKRNLKFSVKVEGKEEYVRVMRWISENCSMKVNEAMIEGKWYPYIHYTESFYSVSVNPPGRFLLFGAFMTNYAGYRPLEEASHYLGRLANIVAKTKMPMAALERECGFNRGTIKNMINGKHDPRFSTIIATINGINRIKETNYSLADLI